MAITGITSNTPKKLLLDAGAFYKNYDLTKGFEENAGTRIGATQGGGSFSAVPTVRKIEVDGAKENVKGLQAIDGWVVTLTANAKEVDADNLALALGAATTASSTEAGVTGSTKITGNADFADENYLTNITWVGRLSGSDDPVIIVVKNALSLNGLSMTMADKAEANIPITITGHYSLDDLDTPPFEIHYPTVS